MKRKKKARIGDLVEISWLDAAAKTNEPLSKMIPAKATNVGVLIRETDTYYVFRHGLYLDDGLDPDMDCTVIPKGWEQEIRVLKDGPKKRRKS